MKCPHCTIEIHAGFASVYIPSAWKKELPADIGCVGQRWRRWSVSYMTCPACSEAIIYLREGPPGLGIEDDARLVEPKAATRPKAPTEVPKELAEDFNEACLVLADSTKASAALSRRCLQGLLRLQGFNQKDLAAAIDALLASKRLPIELAGSVDAIRQIGNFAAHPMKDTNSGAILPVEPEEAEWNLDVLERLFDFFYVEPAITKAKIDALNAKLAAAGKPPLKV